VTFLPFISLGAAVLFLSLAWKKRRLFSSRPYFFWFIYLHLAAVGLHQFEEYGWPGGFRDVFAGVFPFENAASLVPSSAALEALNVFGLMSAFGLIGWIGTRVIWIGLGLLFVNFSNAFFHLVHSVTHMLYVPGTVTATLFYLPLGLFATRYAVTHHHINAPRLLLSFILGTAVSFTPFVHVWILHR